MGKDDGSARDKKEKPKGTIEAAPTAHIAAQDASRFFAKKTGQGKIDAAPTRIIEQAETGEKP